MEEPTDEIARADSRQTPRWLVVVLVPLIGAVLLGAVWIGAHWWDSAPDGWGVHARRAYRTSRTLEASPDDWRVRLEYANQLMTVEFLSPIGLRQYFAMRVDAHCAQALALAPPGGADMCVYPELERLWRAREGSGLLAKAMEALPNTPDGYRDTVHRYAARGAQLAEQWDVCAAQYEAAFALSGEARDALAGGWSALQAMDSASALRLLDAAEAANGGYPGDTYRLASSLPMRPRERAATLAGLRRQADFFHAVRTTAEALARGEDVVVPDWPS